MITNSSQSEMPNRKHSNRKQKQCQGKSLRLLVKKSRICKLSILGLFILTFEGNKLNCFESYCEPCASWFSASFFTAGCREVSFSHSAPEAMKSTWLWYLDCRWTTWLNPCSTRYVGKARSSSLQCFPCNCFQQRCCCARHMSMSLWRWPVFTCQNILKLIKWPQNHYRLFMFGFKLQLLTFNCRN